MEKKYQLPAEFGKKWVKALRGGEYGQAKQMLHERDTNNYCCLGVACIISKVPKSKLLKCSGDLLNNPSFDGYSKIPQQLKNNRDLNSSLAAKNDSGKPFTEIADWIESNVEFI